MIWWVIADWPGSLDSAKRLLHELECEAQREFLTRKKGGELVWADLLSEAESLKDRPSILVAQEQELMSLDYASILNHCWVQKIPVTTVDQLSALRSKDISEMLQLLAQQGYPSRLTAVAWWMKHNNFAKRYENLDFQIRKWLGFQSKLKQARVRRRIEPHGGKRSGRVAFGDKPEERAVVERILFLHKQRQNLTQITNTINAEGHTTLTGKPFRVQTIKNCIVRFGYKSP